MKQVPMKFKGYSWHHNPREIVFENTKQLNETLFKELLELFREGGSGVLTIAGMPSVYAEFESLKLVGKPRPDVLTYSFAFRELMEERDDKRREIIAAENENLWDISYRFGIGIDTLVRLNPQVKRPDILTAGEVVRLC